nr:luciferase [synthetic construct]
MMGIKVLFALICFALVQANPTENKDDIDIVGVEGKFGTTDLETDLFTIVEDMNVISRDTDVDANRADRGRRGRKLPGKKLPKEVLKILEANAQRAGCHRGCLICLSHIKCTAKMKQWLPGRCESWEGDKETGQGGIGGPIVDIGVLGPEIPGFKDLEPMEQFIAQVDLCVDCTTGCLKGLANVKCSDLLKKWLPSRCATFASKIQAQVDKIKGAGGSKDEL